MKLFFLLLSPVISYVPFCVNCKHFKEDLFDNKYGTCKKFPIIYRDEYHLVTGIGNTKPVTYHYCSIARGTSRMCGEEGSMFEGNELNTSSN